MTYYIVIGICIFLLLAVIYVSAKPISMGIEARRNLNHDLKDEDNKTLDEYEEKNRDTKNISDEIYKLNKLKTDGVITEEEYEKAKKKILS
ncbi:SHOCT domain-containing protein [Candidatus Pelagibacter sp.]|nr:SHOCT domain-containing protein [Candidatus Pelagibacter sp.]